MKFIELIKQNNLAACLFWGSLIILGLTLAFWLKAISIKNYKEQLKGDNVQYTIGIYRGSTHTPRSAVSYTNYDINIDGQSVSCRQSIGKRIGESKAKKGDRFLVIYSKQDPIYRYTLMLFDHPIKDSADFLRYIDQFKTKPINMNEYLK